MATEIVASAAKHSAAANIDALYDFTLINPIFDISDWLFFKSMIIKLIPPQQFQLKE